MSIKSPKSYTLKAAKEFLRDKHMTITMREGEYCVNHNGSGKDTAYYTDSLEDAVNTGIDMARNS